MSRHEPMSKQAMDLKKYAGEYIMVQYMMVNATTVEELQQKWKQDGVCYLADGSYVTHSNGSYEFSSNEDGEKSSILVNVNMRDHERPEIIAKPQPMIRTPDEDDVIAHIVEIVAIKAGANEEFAIEMEMSAIEVYNLAPNLREHIHDALSNTKTPSGLYKYTDIMLSDCADEAIGNLTVSEYEKIKGRFLEVAKALEEQKAA